MVPSVPEGPLSLSINWTENRLAGQSEVVSGGIQSALGIFFSATERYRGTWEADRRLPHSWLMIAHADQFHLTHEMLADMLGVRRSGISVAAGVRQRKQLIKYTRGRITVLDRKGLTAVNADLNLTHFGDRHRSSISRASRFEDLRSCGFVLVFIRSQPRISLSRRASVSQISARRQSSTGISVPWRPRPHTGTRVQHGVRAYGQLTEVLQGDLEWDVPANWENCDGVPWLYLT